MTGRRGRHLARNSLIFLGSAVGHVVVFLFVIGALAPYHLPQRHESIVEVRIVPSLEPMTPYRSRPSSATATAIAAHIMLHKNEGGPPASAITIPATPAPIPSTISAGARGLPGGTLPGGGLGLRSGRLGCANAEALHLSKAEEARCEEAFGEGVRKARQLDPIGVATRAELDKEAAQELAEWKYRNSTPSNYRFDILSQNNGSPGNPQNTIDPTK